MPTTRLAKRRMPNGSNEVLSDRTNVGNGNVVVSPPKTRRLQRNKTVNSNVVSKEQSKTQKAASAEQPAKKNDVKPIEIKYEVKNVDTDIVAKSSIKSQGEKLKPTSEKLVLGENKKQSHGVKRKQQNNCISENEAGKENIEKLKLKQQDIKKAVENYTGKKSTPNHPSKKIKISTKSSQEEIGDENIEKVIMKPPSQVAKTMKKTTTSSTLKTQSHTLITSKKEETNKENINQQTSKIKTNKEQCFKGMNENTKNNATNQFLKPQPLHKVVLNLVKESEHYSLADNFGFADTSFDCEPIGNSTRIDAEIFAKPTSGSVKFDENKPYRYALYAQPKLSRKPSQSSQMSMTTNRNTATSGSTGNNLNTKLQKVLSVSTRNNLNTKLQKVSSVSTGNNLNTKLQKVSSVSTGNNLNTKLQKVSKQVIKQVKKEPKPATMAQKKITDMMKPATRAVNKGKNYTTFFENSRNSSSFHDDDESIAVNAKPSRKSYIKKSKDKDPEEPSTEQIMRELKKKNQISKTKTKKLTKETKDLESWAKSTNSMFDDVDKFELTVIE